MLKFSKMHGLGNDFVVIDAIHQDISLTTAQVQFLADRHRGIGCDQVLLVEKSQLENVDFRYRIFNADGGEVAQCGNGARCFAQFVRDKGLTDKATIAVETSAGIIYPTLHANGNISVDMGQPHFLPAEVPFSAEEPANTYMLTVAPGEQIEIATLSMGNPHAVILVDAVETAPVDTLGPSIESHPQFPERVNVGFMQLCDRQTIKLRVFERGAGETSACGTGACAAVVSGIRRGLLARQVTVQLKGGSLLINWPDDDANVIMTGPATQVFDGEIAWATLNLL
ncbi:Diaminopimelate epimerase [Methylophaga frappieri]|uniref:Diaminopimelate epimerase n=1 Tax=Methylophaga frappieri (strain ATCC BAA-2434 / DSM 25690 / JAM7) TaxID=754477 RepID=I1YKC4_METFJ|nr:diaminopimelate epimerase [Methylophaga frappieri]AFJ03367.1 Diaminopimelate epimerase [Methylophaga frappieri]